MPTFITFLRTFNFLITVVIPLIVLGAALVWTDFPWAGEEGFGMLVRWVAFLMTIPITAVYFGIMFKEFYPKDLLGALRMFVPFVLSVAVGVWTSTIFETYDWLVLQSITDYIGLNVCFFGGLLYLVSENVGYEWRRSKKDAVRRVGGVLIIMGFALIPAIFFFVQGIFYYEKLLPQFDAWARWLLYLFGIATMVFIYFPKLGKLYGQGKL